MSQLIRGRRCKRLFVRGPILFVYDSLVYDIGDMRTTSINLILADCSFVDLYMFTLEIRFFVLKSFGLTEFCCFAFALLGIQFVARIN